jgi:hypothetical protein
MIMLDPYYRTLRGFLVLIEQEWCSFGHKFSDRNGWTVNGWKDDDRCPIFEQFIHCVYQMLHQRPSAFEFNENLLIFIVDNIYNGWFGNFYGNTECERRGLIRKSYSLWLFVLERRDLFVNDMYSLTIRELIPVVSTKNVVIWEKRFNGWSNTIWRFSWDNLCSEFKEEDFESVSLMELSANCCACKATFGLFKYRYSCKSCGLAFCSACLSSESICQSCRGDLLGRAESLYFDD